jgi:hypothetical protein
MDHDLMSGFLVIGAWPCGITLANLLGIDDAPAVVIDADAEPYPLHGQPHLARQGGFA